MYSIPANNPLLNASNNIVHGHFALDITSGALTSFSGIIPDGVFVVWATVVGGGGGGDGGAGGSGGAGGGVIYKFPILVVPGMFFNMTKGTGGSIGNSGNNSILTLAGYTLTANGGTAGSTGTGGTSTIVTPTGTTINGYSGEGVGVGLNDTAGSGLGVIGAGGAGAGVSGGAKAGNDGMVAIEW